MQVINPASRLVGGNFIESSEVMTFYGRRDGQSMYTRLSVCNTKTCMCVHVMYACLYTCRFTCCM